MIEKWRPVRDFAGFYEVSDQGRVRSLARVLVDRRGRPRQRREKLMKGTIGKRGYDVVSLRRPGAKQIKRPIHRLVAEAFRPPRADAPEVNNQDGNKRNNAAGNLEWATHAENMAHAWDTGLTPRPRASSIAECRA